MVKNKKLNEVIQGLGITSLITGGMLKMFGNMFGLEKVEKKDIAKGVIDMVFEDYENRIKDYMEQLIKSNDKNDKLKEENTTLKEKIERLELKLEQQKTTTGRKR